MTLVWTAEDVLRAVQGQCLHEQNWVAHGVSIDSRTCQPGDLYVAIKGDKMDGHAYVGAAFEKGGLVDEIDGGFAMGQGPDLGGVAILAQGQVHFPIESFDSGETIAHSFVERGNNAHLMPLLGQRFGQRADHVGQAPRLGVRVDFRAGEQDFEGLNHALMRSVFM